MDYDKRPNMLPPRCDSLTNKTRVFKQKYLVTIPARKADYANNSETIIQSVSHSVTQLGKALHSEKI